MWRSKFLVVTIFWGLFTFFHTANLYAQGSWKIIRQIDTLTIYTDVDFVDKNNGWVVGYVPESLRPSEGVIIHTRDGGESWEHQKSETGKSFWRVEFVDSLTGWVLADSGMVLRTNNGGRDWNQEPWRGYFFFIDSQRGWRIGKDARRIFYTNDGANTWTLLYTHPDASLSMISFVDSLHGWVMESGRAIFHTRDGGHTWEEQYRCSSCSLSKWDFVDSLRGWVLAHVDPSSWMVLKTYDGGQSWNVRALESAWYYSDVSFVDSLQGWIVGSTSVLPIILYTDDGGENWISQASGLGEGMSLFSACFIDNCTGWAVGHAKWELALGTVLKYMCNPDKIDDNTLNQIGWSDSYQVLQSYPNPFNLGTTIKYYIPHAAQVKVSIYDVRGRLVKNLTSNEMLSRGYHEVYWYGKDGQGNAISSGVYLCVLKSEKNVKAIKLVAIK